MNSAQIDSKNEKNLPGDTSLVSSPEELIELSEFDKGNYMYTIEDYFAKPKAKSFQLSPDGMYLSYQEKDENKKNHVYVKCLKNGEITRAIEEQDELIRGYGWANEKRLIFIMDTGGDENYHVFATNVDGSDTKELTPFDGVQVQILQMLKEDKEHIIIGMNKTNKEVFEPYRINIYTGALKQLYENDNVEYPIMDYIFDKDGELRGYTRLLNGVDIELYYAKENQQYECIKKLNWKDTFSIKSFSYNPENKHEAYVVSNLTSDRSEIYLYDLKKDAIIKKLFSDSLYDVSGIGLSRKRNFELDYFSFQGEKKVIHPVSSFYTKLHDTITKRFPDQQYAIADKTDSEDKYLIYVQSDVIYGVYYVYDVAQNSFELLYNLMPQLKEEEMATMQPISFKSRDGITIYGYLTLPNNIASLKKVPLIVNPHGGPQGIRDTWGFNPENQLFASRGYATLQVNFRISGGYGRKFLESGFKQIGRKAMDDVEDGIDYVINQGSIDKEKIAIYGGSHGGYAVLRGLTKTPDLYCCGVDYVGVSNLFSFMKTIPPYWKPYLKIIKEIWYDEDIAEENTIMREVSPVFQIDKIKKPLFVVQGANDPRVNIDESDQIVRALRAKGFETPYMVKYDEGHGFAKEENSIEMYKAMMGFLAKHLQ
ncbi:alpha/beta hydrolase family protein [Aquimarina sp. W85]|uniref:alpha/beta hydrolase family protein n=1 Tax=Aquimarina rhodophyticola TaxID=3342246 RepID=UPI00366D3F96